MALPIRTTLDDVTDLLAYFSKKPTGATVQEAKTVLDPKRLDGRKLAAMKAWGLIEDGDGEIFLLGPLNGFFSVHSQNRVKAHMLESGADALSELFLIIGDEYFEVFGFCFHRNSAFYLRKGAGVNDFNALHN